MKRPRSLKSILSALALFLVLGACEEQTICHTYRSLPARGWAKGDTLRFDVVLPDSNAPCLLTLEVRHSSSFPYRALPIRFALQGDSLLPVCDTLTLSIADEAGNWLGQGGSNLRVVSSPVVSLPLDAKDTCRISLTSVLPDTLLPGVSDVGLRIAWGTP